jgi:ribosomal protein L18
LATSEVTKVNTVKPRYSTHWSEACIQVQSVVETSTGIRASVSSASQKMAQVSGMIQGSTPASTSSRIPGKALSLK